MRLVALALLCLSTLGIFTYKSTADALNPLFVVDLGGTVAQAGAQGSLVFCLAVALRFATGAFADRFGDKITMQIGALCMTLGGIATALSANPEQMLVARCIAACGLASFYPSATSLTSKIAPEGSTGLWLGVLRFCTVAPVTIAPAFFLDIANARGFGICYFAMGLLALGAFFFVTVARGSFLLAKPAPGNRTNSPLENVGSRAVPTLRGSLHYLFRNRSMGYGSILALSALASGAFVVVSSYAILFAEHHALAVDFSLYFVLFGLGGMISNPLFGFLADRIDAGKLVAMGFGCMAIGLAAMALAPIDGPLLYLAAAGIGFGKSGVSVALLALLANRSDRQSRTLALSLLQSAGDIGAAASSAIVGTLFDATGFSSGIVFAFCLMTLAGSATALLRFANHRPC